MLMIPLGQEGEVFSYFSYNNEDKTRNFDQEEKKGVFIR